MVTRASLGWLPPPEPTWEAGGKNRYRGINAISCTLEIKLEKKRKPSFFKGIATRAPAASCRDVRKMHSGKACKIDILK